MKIEQRPLVTAWLSGAATAMSVFALAHGAGSMPRWFYWLGLPVALLLYLGARDDLQKTQR